MTEDELKGGPYVVESPFGTSSVSGLKCDTPLESPNYLKKKLMNMLVKETEHYLKTIREHGLRSPTNIEFIGQLLAASVNIFKE